uniref:Uncharacterized protein n=1 Tax=Arundo donax TaxID=35708 RepID=A0A0A9DNR5_ARUDO
MIRRMLLVHNMHVSLRLKLLLSLHMCLEFLIPHGVHQCVQFSGWWCKAVKQVPKELRKGVNSLVTLIAWEIWKHRCECVFNGTPPNVDLVVRTISHECSLWCMAGARDLACLLQWSLAQGS